MHSSSFYWFYIHLPQLTVIEKLQKCNTFNGKGLISHQERKVNVVNMELELLAIVAKLIAEGFWNIADDVEQNLFAIAKEKVKKVRSTNSFSKSTRKAFQRVLWTEYYTKESIRFFEPDTFTRMSMVKSLNIILHYWNCRMYVWSKEVNFSRMFHFPKKYLRK